MIKVAILGSCCSRDILNYPPCTERDVKPGVCISRGSFASMMSQPLKIDESEIKLDSAFQRRMVLWDVNKLAFYQLECNPADFLLIDFMEERFDLARIGDTYVTLSDEFARSGIDYQCRFSWQSLSNHLADRSLDSWFRRFCGLLQNIYPPDRIILNKVHCCDAYYDLKGMLHLFSADIRNRTKGYNAKLKRLNERFCELVPGCRVLDLSKYYAAYEGHRWGLYYAHYQNEFYSQASRENANIVAGKKSFPFRKWKLAITQTRRRRKLVSSHPFPK